VRQDSEAVTVFLRPGSYFVGGAKYRVRTLLGSCVSVTLWHPARRMGAISHSLLPRRLDATGECCGSDGRYCNEAVARMIEELARAGVDARECEAKLFGGGHMFDGVPGYGRLGDVGRENGECARREVLEQGIRIVSQSLFGAGHRELIFDIQSGDVWMRQVEPARGP
jgi:chemotaxis protein CheD